MYLKVLRSLAEPGEGVGLLAAQVFFVTLITLTWQFEFPVWQLNSQKSLNFILLLFKFRDLFKEYYFKWQYDQKKLAIFVA